MAAYIAARNEKGGGGDHGDLKAALAHAAGLDGKCLYCNRKPPKLRLDLGKSLVRWICRDTSSGIGGQTETMVLGTTQQLASPPEAIIAEALGRRSIVLVGMMGSGKSSIGRRVALRLGMPFVDADTEIEKAAGMTIADIFSIRGEAEFRSGEARVILRLLEGEPQVLSTGGGAFMNCDTRTVIASKGVSIWLNADLDVLMKRIRRRHDRPLLKTDDPAATLRTLMQERYPTYALADLTVESRDVPHDRIVDEIVSALAAHLGAAQGLINVSAQGDRTP
jgi:shikimate kinase